MRRVLLAVAAVLILGLVVPGSATSAMQGKGKPKGDKEPPLIIVFRDAPGDLVRSDGGGAYIGGEEGIDTAAFDHADEVPISVEVNRPPEEVGRWLPPMSWPVHGVHAAVLRTGEVLHYHTTLASQPASVWNPVTGTFREVSWDSSDLFCVGHSFLSNGELYLTGGTQDGPGGCGLKSTHTFNPVSGAFKRLGDMATARWYPTNVTLGDGRVMILLSSVLIVNHRMQS